jgi:probable F420-dependent oxidoreductase
MKVGANLINFGPSANPRNLGRWIEVVEGLGYHLLLCSDHIAVTNDVHERYPDPFYEPVTTLAWMAAKSERIEIGSTVIIVPYRHPLETARAFANIDQLSGGRTIFGAGIGWAEQEFQTLDVPFNKRGRITDEYLKVIRAAWSEEVISFDGEYVSFEGVHTTPLPQRRPRPPIWIGGDSDAALRRAVRLGDAWHPIRIRLTTFGDIELARLHRIAAEEGMPVPDACPRIRMRIHDKPLDDNERFAGEGTLDQIHDDLSQLEKLGCPYVLLDSYYYDVDATRKPETAWRMLATIAEQVLDLENQTVR